MKILLLAVGQLRGGPERELCDRYLTRLKSYGSFEIQELKNAQGLLGRPRPEDWVVLFDVKGRPTSSEELAEKLGSFRTSGRNRVVFVIGGDEGVPDEIAARADEKISLGPVTLPHRLFRVVALEQLYRASSILAGEPYHRP